MMIFSNSLLWQAVENGLIKEGDTFNSQLHDSLIQFDGDMFFDVIEFEETGELAHALFEKGDQWELVTVEVEKKGEFGGSSEKIKELVSKLKADIDPEKFKDILNNLPNQQQAFINQINHDITKRHNDLMNNIKKQRRNE